MKTKNTKKIFILLTRFPSVKSSAISLLTKCYYTHASIGLEDNLNIFYSFVDKGFIVEEISRYIKPDRPPFPCQMYVLDVSPEIYSTIQRMLNRFVQKKKRLRYSRVGLLLSLIHIPYKREDYYFCSQFVAEILHRSRAVHIKKNSSFFYPKDFKSIPGIRLQFQGNLQSLLEYSALVPALP